MINVTYLEDQGIYQFKLPWGMWTVNDVEVDASTSGSVPMTTKTKPVIRRIEYRTHITHYIHNGMEMSLEEYAKTESLLTAKGTWDDEECEFKFSDLDDEYAYKKFRRDTKAETTRIRMQHAMDIVIVHTMLDSGSEYIVPMFSVDSNKPDLVQFLKSKLESDTCRKWVEDNELTIEIPTHGHLRFAKINNNYVFNDEFDGKYPIVTTTMEKAQAMLKTVPERVINRLRQTVTPVKESHIKVATLIDRLSSIQRECRSLANSRTPSRSEGFNNIARHIHKVVEELNTIK